MSDLLWTPEGWTLERCHRHEAGDFGLWRLRMTEPLRVKCPGFADREFRFSPGQVTRLDGFWVGHSDMFGDDSPEFLTCRSAVEWLLRDHEIAIQAVRDRQQGEYVSLPLARPAVTA